VQSENQEKNGEWSQMTLSSTAQERTPLLVFWRGKHEAHRKLWAVVSRRQWKENFF
jgi:hypothetical protein